MQKLLTLILFCSIIFLGCVRTEKYQVAVYPIGEEDIFTLPIHSVCNVPEYSKELEDGSLKTVPAHNQEVIKNGQFVSDFFMNEVMEAKQVQ